MIRRQAFVAAVAACIAAASLSVGSTYAAWSDVAVINGNQIGGSVWAPDPPAACGEGEDYQGGVIYGTTGNDTLYGGNQSQIIMGLGGNDVIHAGNSGDCLVGGTGNDNLYGGNGKDILLGGDGDDLLDGGNAKDYLDAGGSGGDVCEGGNGMDQVVDCGGPVAVLLSQTTAPAQKSVIEVQPTTAPPAGSGAAVDAEAAGEVEGEDETPVAAPSGGANTDKTPEILDESSAVEPAHTDGEASIEEPLEASLTYTLTTEGRG